MADNVTLPGTGSSVAADEIGGNLYQRVKIAVGADGAAADLAPGQVAMAASLPVAIASNQSAVPITDNSGSLTVDSPQLPAALGAGGGIKVDGSGTALPVSVATVPSHAVTNAGTFAVQESGAALTALQLIDNCIAGSEAQVDIITVPAPLNVVGGGTQDSALRVTVATDSSGVLSVDDNDATLSVDDGGGSLTVDGTVAVSGTVAVTDNSGSLTVDSAQLPAALAAGGGLKVEGVSDGVALTIGGAAADDAAASGNPVPIGALYQATPDSVDNGDVGRLRMTARRAIINAPDQSMVVLVNAYGYSVDLVGDMTVVRSPYVNSATYVEPAATYMLGDDAAFDTTPVRVRIPMTNWHTASIGVYNGLGVSVTLSVEEILSLDGDIGGSHATLYSATLANNGFIHLAPYAGGSGAAYHAQVAGLENPALYFQVSITPASDPSTGEWRLHVVRR
jgi:hypothetical protein